MIYLRIMLVLLMCLSVLSSGFCEEAVKTRTILKVDFEKFKTIDWGIGHDIQLPYWNEKSHMTPRNDGGDWKPFYWEKSTQTRNGKGHSLEIRLVNPTEAIRGCGTDIVFKGATALPPDREITVSVWTNCSRHDGDYTNVVIGWEPGDHKGITGGVQDYAKTSRRTRESGWVLQTLKFRSHRDPNVGDKIGLGFAGHTKRSTDFQNDPNPPKDADCVGVVALQPVLSAYFDDLTVTVEE